MAIAHQDLVQALAHFHEGFTSSWVGPQRYVDRRFLTQLWLCRLLLLFHLQQAGWLGQGDRWYLHNQLGLQAQQRTDGFFQHFLHPLCHQALALPDPERPVKFANRLAEIPYLGGSLFLAHPLEQQFWQLNLPDDPIEQFLGWLAEQPWSASPVAPTEAGISLIDLAIAWEQAIFQAPNRRTVYRRLSDETAVMRSTVDAHVLQAMATAGLVSSPSLPDLLAQLNDESCHHLVAQVLPAVTILDPNCGAGVLLLIALERLQWVYQTCWEFAQSSSHATLRAWKRAAAVAESPQVWWTRQLLTRSLYGVDVRPEAMITTQTLLWLKLLSAASSGAPKPLPNLDFNITTGNTLIGFIRVDAESFDKIAPRRSKQTGTADTVLQGNLLQPLMAASYRDTLAEKQIRVEHYQAQTQAMGTEGGVPEYLQTAFLRDRVEAVNQAAQQKLDDLLFETLSRKLGIYIKEPQPSGRYRKRLLTREDVAALTPFHWGFFFNHIITQGGFDVVLTRSPETVLRPSADTFYHQHQEWFEQRQIALSTFRRSRRQLLQIHPDLANLWAAYAGQIGCLRDYVRRSDAYDLPILANARRAIPLRALLQQRCAALSQPHGIPPYVD